MRASGTARALSCEERKSVWLHNLATINGQPAMMYYGQVPWHGLGEELNKPATAAEAISTAHLDWEVEKQPIFVPRGKNFARLPNRHVP